MCKNKIGIEKEQFERRAHNEERAY